MDAWSVDLLLQPSAMAGTEKWYVSVVDGPFARQEFVEEL
jgi:hypothetical protein